MFVSGQLHWQPVHTALILSREIQSLLSGVYLLILIMAWSTVEVYDSYEAVAPAKYVGSLQGKVVRTP